MSKHVERQIIDEWISRNCPNGLLRLAERSSVSADTIIKVRLGYVPRKSGTRARLCKALGVAESELFPLARKQAGKAS